MANWAYFNKFEAINDKYLPAMGEGDSKATQIVTAVNKLIYKWFNDGDVFDNTHGLEGWANDLSSYANWLERNTEAERILYTVYECRRDSDYEALLQDLAEYLLDEQYLAEQATLPVVGSIYQCKGPFKFEQYDEDEEDGMEYGWDEDEE